MVEPVPLVCPADGTPLAAGRDELSCASCDRRFPNVAGIPDLRLSYARADLSWEEDVERARELAAGLEALDLPSLLRKHWRAKGRPETEVERRVAGELASVGRSEAYVAAIERQRGRSLTGSDRFLEVGCGTAGLAAVAARRAGDVVALDHSMRSLVLARRRLLEAGLDRVRLVCCGAERPPFAPGWFDVLAASDVIEHVADQRAFVAACERLLRPGGMLFLATPNRFSLGLEPHMRLWAVGWLPPGLAKRYVRALRRRPYVDVRLLSSRGLRRLLAAQEMTARIVSPEIPPATQALYAGLELRAVRAYNRARRLAPLRRALLAIGPFFHVFATKRAPRVGGGAAARASPRSPRSRANEEINPR